MASLDTCVAPQGYTDDVRVPANAEAGLATMERRLRELGATYYVLEKWGDEGDLYRFECHVAISADADHNRYFEATAERPHSAVDTVLRQVELWRSDRSLR